MTQIQNTNTGHAHQQAPQVSQARPALKALAPRGPRTPNLSGLALAGTLASALVGALVIGLPAQAQVAGGTTTATVSITESTQLAAGWSVKKTLMGKTLYNEAGDKVGKVEDLIISPDKNVSYVIVGAGGFIGIGRHDVAIPVAQIQDRGGKLVMAGVNAATARLRKSMDVDAG